VSTSVRKPAGPRRTLVAVDRGLLSNTRVYRTADALEIDRVEGYDVTRRSVLFDEVLLVTRHKAFGWPLLVASAVMVVMMIALCGLIATESPRAAGIVFSIFGLPFAIAALLRLALRLDIVTVYGIRGKCAMPFWFGKRRAREVYTLVCRLAREQQPSPRTVARNAAPPLGPPSTEPDSTDGKPLASA
jgi:hypothetical protein